MDKFLEALPVVTGALNEGFLQTLKLFAVTLAGALPLGLLVAFGSMSRLAPWPGPSTGICGGGSAPPGGSPGPSSTSGPSGCCSGCWCGPSGAPP